MGRQQSRLSGGEFCTDGRACKPVTWWLWPLESSRPTHRSAITPIPWPRCGTHMMMQFGWPMSQRCRASRQGVDAVVSLCRVNDDDLPADVEQIDIRLIDIVGPDANPNLDFVLTDAVRLIEQLRNEGRTVLLHCVACQS